MRPRRVALVGAGIAGLACAQRLDSAGVAVTIFDKGRRPGGRMATRRLDGALYDHGAQFATAHGSDLGTAMAQWSERGLAAPWPAAGSPRSTRWVGVPSMAAIPAHLAGSLTQPPLQDRHVGQILRVTKAWQVRHHAAGEMRPSAVSTEGGEIAGPFDAILISAPAPQTAGLLRTIDHPFADAADRASYAPCWALLASFADHLAKPDVWRAEASSDTTIEWYAREASRPGRDALPERFVIHAGAEWSRAWLERDEAEVRAALLATFAAPIPPVAALAHRWRYARVDQAVGTPCLWDEAAGVGACGDWCLGGRVEAAWDSGVALAEAVLTA